MEPTEHIELSEKDEADLANLLSGGEEPSYHTILEVWRETLAPAKNELTRRVTPTWANRIVSSYASVQFADMNAFRDVYFGMFIQMLSVVEEEISTDDECLKNYTPSDDAENNAAHYKSILLEWQKLLLLWELEWECTNPDAAIVLAAIAEVHKAVFGQTGITQFLDNIGLAFDADDQVHMAEALNEFRVTVEAEIESRGTSE